MAKIAPYSCELMIAGWNEKQNRGEVLFRSLHPMTGQLEPKKTYFVLKGHFSCGPDSHDLGNPDNFDPKRRGIRAFDNARRAINDLTCGQAANAVWGHSVGGWIDATHIGATGIMTETIHRWPDQVGAKINPATDATRTGVAA